jgi:hypothetical protein
MAADGEIYRKISVRIWGDERFRRLSPPQPCGQALWLWLLSGPFTTQVPGIVLAGRLAMAEKLAWPVEAFDEAFDEVSREGLAIADWETQFVWLPNGIKHNEPQSPNVVIGWRSTWLLVPECGLRLKATSTLRSFLRAKGQAFADAFDKAIPELSRNPLPIQEQEQEQEQKQEVLRARGGVGEIGAEWEKRMGAIWSSMQSYRASEWLQAGHTVERIIEAMVEAIAAKRDGRAISLETAWAQLVTTTPPGAPMHYAAGKRRGRGTGNVTAADIAKMATGERERS